MRIVICLPFLPLSPLRRSSVYVMPACTYLDNAFQLGELCELRARQKGGGEGAGGGGPNSGVNADITLRVVCVQPRPPLRVQPLPLPLHLERLLVRRRSPPYPHRKINLPITLF